MDGDFLPTDNWPRLDRFREHSIELPVASIKVNPKDEKSLVQLLQRALDFGKGVVLIEAVDKSKTAQSKSKAKAKTKSKLKPTLFSIERACPQCHSSFR